MSHLQPMLFNLSHYRIFLTISTGGKTNQRYNLSKLVWGSPSFLLLPQSIVLHKLRVLKSLHSDTTLLPNSYLSSLEVKLLVPSIWTQLFPPSEINHSYMLGEKLFYSFLLRHTTKTSFLDSLKIICVYKTWRYKQLMIKSYRYIHLVLSMPQSVVLFY